MVDVRNQFVDDAAVVSAGRLPGVACEPKPADQRLDQRTTVTMLANRALIALIAFPCLRRGDGAHSGTITFRLRVTVPITGRHLTSIPHMRQIRGANIFMMLLFYLGPAQGQNRVKSI